MRSEKCNILKQVKTLLGNDIVLWGCPPLEGGPEFLQQQFEQKFRGGDNYILVVGVFHGDEPQGKTIIEQYLMAGKYAQPMKLSPPPNPLPQGEGEQACPPAFLPSCHLLFIPCLNPDGLAAGTRTNANGVDLNRNFPAKNWVLSGKDEFFGGEEPASEIETRFLIEVLEEYKPQLILTLHAPYKVVNYDGPAREIAEKIAEITGYPVEENIGYPTPGSFGTYAGIERQIPTITLELDETCPLEELYPPVSKIFDKILLTL